MKRKLSLLLVILLVAVMFGACGSQPSSPGNSEATDPSAGDTQGGGGSVTTEEELSPELPAVPYNCEISVLQREDRWKEEWNPDQESNVILEEALLRRNAYLEDKYGINFKHYGMPLNETTSRLQNAILTNTGAYDFLSYGVFHSASLAQNGCLRTIQSIPHINLDMPWWYTELNEELSYQETNFFAIGSSNICSLWTASCVFYNVDMAEAQGIGTNFYQLVKDHEWTLEALLEAASTVGYLDRDSIVGISPGDRFGISQTAGGWYNAFYGSGLRLATRDSSGRWEVNVSDEKIIDRITQIIIYQNNSELSVPLSAGIDQWNCFRDDNSLFLIEFICVANSLKTATIEYGILPSPLLESGQTEYYTSFHKTHGSAISVPTDVMEEDLEMIGAILEDANYYSRRVQWPAFYDTLLKGQVARNPESMEMLDYVFDNLIMDPVLLYSAQLDDTIRDLVANNKYTNVQSSISGIVGDTQSDLDKIMDKYEEVINGGTG